MKLHKIQRELLQLIKDDALEGMSLREIGTMIGVDHPQKIKHHLSQLEKKGYIKISNDGNFQFLGENASDVTYIPLYGNAQCGPSTLFTEENIEKMIPFSPSMFGIARSEKLFFVQASGNSMYPKISEGDLVLIHSQQDVINDEVALVSLNESLQIKQFLRIDPLTIALKSFNTEFKTQIISEEDDQLHILGAVKKIISSA